MAGKPMLTPRVMDSQSMLELPERDMLGLITIVTGDVLSHDNVNVAANVCVNAVLSAQGCAAKAG